MTFLGIERNDDGGYFRQPVVRDRRNGGKPVVNGTVGFKNRRRMRGDFGPDDLPQTVIYGL